VVLVDCVGHDGALEVGIAAPRTLQGRECLTLCYVGDEVALCIGRWCVWCHFWC
jgi:hypothetical protein